MCGKVRKTTGKLQICAENSSMCSFIVEVELHRGGRACATSWKQDLC